jgi:hypothetical protein
MHMIVLHHHIQIHPYIIETLNIDFLEVVSQLRLIYKFLHRVQVECKGLVLSQNRAP